jgi:hypothetical protein
MNSHRVPGIEAYPDLVSRFDVRLGRLLTKDDCGGCKVRELIDTFKKLVADRQKRDNDFRRR